MVSLPVTFMGSHSAFPPSSASAASIVLQIQCWLLVPSAQAQHGQAGGFSFGACPELDTVRFFKPEYVRVILRGSFTCVAYQLAIKRAILEQHGHHMAATATIRLEKCLISQQTAEMNTYVPLSQISETLRTVLPG